jgi:hypothetical protein
MPPSFIIEFTALLLLGSDAAMLVALAGAARAAHDLLIYSCDEEKRSVRCR